MPDNESPSIRDSLSDAFDDLTPAKEEAAPAPAEVEVSPAEPSDVPEPGAEQPETDSADKPPADAEAAPVVAADGKPAPVAADPAPKAPASWRPAVREHWAKLPPEVQKEVAKREHETAVAMQESAGARRAAEQIQQVTAPYMGFLRSEGVEPLQAINSLLSHAQVLRQGTPEVKARAIAQWVKQFNVPLDALAAAIDGSPQQAQAQAAQPQIDPAQITQQVMAQLGQQRQQYENQRQAQAVAQFTDGREFIDDVREDMADMMEGAGRRGVELSLEEAYTRACRMHPEVSRIMQQREEAKKAGTARAATQRIRAASSSVRSSPAAPGPRRNESDDRRAALESAWGES